MATTKKLSKHPLPSLLHVVLFGVILLGSLVVIILSQNTPMDTRSRAYPLAPTPKPTTTTTKPPKCAPGTTPPVSVSGTCSSDSTSCTYNQCYFPKIAKDASGKWVIVPPKPGEIPCINVGETRVNPMNTSEFYTCVRPQASACRMILTCTP
jgi:hypothetical protein